MEEASWCELVIAGLRGGRARLSISAMAHHAQSVWAGRQGYRSNPFDRSRWWFGTSTRTKTFAHVMLPFLPTGTQYSLLPITARCDARRDDRKWQQPKGEV